MSQGDPWQACVYSGVLGSLERHSLSAFASASTVSSHCPTGVPMLAGSARAQASIYVNHVGGRLELIVGFFLFAVCVCTRSCASVHVCLCVSLCV